MARDELLRVARWFDEADSVTAHALFAAAFGMYPARWLGEPCEDDGVPVVTSWWRGPRVSAELGAGWGPAPTAPVDDHSEQRARLRDDAEAAAHWRRAAAEELRDALGTGTVPGDTTSADVPADTSPPGDSPSDTVPSDDGTPGDTPTGESGLVEAATPNTRNAPNGPRPWEADASEPDSAQGTGADADSAPEDQHDPVDHEPDPSDQPGQSDPSDQNGEPVDSGPDPHTNPRPDPTPQRERAVDLSGPAIDVLMELLAAALATGDPAAAPRTSGDLDLDLRIHVSAEPGRTLRLRGAGGELVLAGLDLRATPFAPAPGTVDGRPDGDPDPAGGR